MTKRFTMFLLLGLLFSRSHAYITYKDSIYSDILGKYFQTAVMVPIEYLSQTEKNYPVLYALHGMGDGNYTFWSDVLAFKQRIIAKPMIVAMFNNKFSMYENETDFFFKEWIPFVDSNYRTLTDGANRSVTGFSSGGYGCLHYMLTHPDMFSSSIPMSGAVDYIVNGFNVIQRIKDSIDVRNDVPPISIFCGTEDGLLPGNDRLADSLATWGHDYVYTTAPGGHTGTYWSATCPSIVDYAWEHFDIPPPSGISNPVVTQPLNRLPSTDTRYYNCRGQQVNTIENRTGVYLKYDGKEINKIVIIK